MNKRFLKGESASAFKHGHDYSSPTYRSWKVMKNRCTRPLDKQWMDYGGRGITVCNEWMTFSEFLKDMGIRPNNKTLDRIDNNGNSEPSNCRWAEIKTQRRNRRDNHIVEYNGTKMTLVEACELSGIPYGTAISRINRYGWTEQRAFNAPSNRRSRSAMQRV